MDKNIQAEILKYLQDNKSANTFKLARNLGVDRSKLTRELMKLHESGLIDYRTGAARFLSAPKPALPEPVQKISQPKTKKTEAEKTWIRKEAPSASAKLAEENKKLRAKLAELKSHFEQQAGIERKLKAQNTHVGRLEEEIRTLQQQTPKVIRKTIVRYVPKIVVRSIPAKSTQTEKMSTSLSVEARKPTISPSWLSNIHRNISQLSVPKVFEQKIELKGISLNLSKLRDNFCQLEIPELLRKGI